MAMKKLLLTGIAALFLATGTVPADNKLPEHILGRWCYDYVISAKTQDVYFDLITRILIGARVQI
jgi:hypothetical protein